MDPRVKVSRQDLADLLDFQQRVAKALGRSGALEAQRKRATKLLEAAQENPTAAPLRSSVDRVKGTLDKLPAAPEEDPKKANGALRSLASDLESADAAPTAPQREMLFLYEKGIETFDSKWKTFSTGPYSDLAAKLDKLGIKGE
jgi:hypothetical protein